MERMLKRVGKKQQQSSDDTAVGKTKPGINLSDCEDVFRKLLGSNSLLELTPRAITRRFCAKKNRGDNELYRSNSFKFERFERTDSEDLALVAKQVAHFKSFMILTRFNPHCPDDKINRKIMRFK
ncbi:hypothetical protein AAG570_006667 [Ranatra chinensis]|uniref:Uncharacterized protein n=1 Tax=Ranatra chinensis TaxID=642074 RepID=A0ABD0YUP2_9HEMI